MGIDLHWRPNGGMQRYRALDRMTRGDAFFQMMIQRYLLKPQDRYGAGWNK